MEYRKLISFGKSSFIVSLPKSWVTQNKLKKGDLVYFEESGSSLVLSHQKGADDEEKEKIIFIDGKTLSRVAREVSAAYITNYRQIVLKGKEVKNKVKEFQTIIQNLIALEIMEQSSDSITAKDFLNMDKVSLTEIIRKMDIVTRTMFKESCQIFEEDNYKQINERDKDINRLYFLLYRTVLYNFENPMKAMKNFNLTPKELIKLHKQGFYIEAIADEVRRTIRYARLLKVPPHKQKKIQDMLIKLNEIYLETMKACHTNDAELALKMSDNKLFFNQELDILEKDVQKTEYLNQTISRLRRMVTNIHNLGRVAYTLTA